MAAEFEYADGSSIDPQLRPDEDCSCEADDGPRDLLPWADPYIARLVRQHELQCARSRRQQYDGEPSVRFAPRGEPAAPASEGSSPRRRMATRR